MRMGNAKSVVVEFRRGGRMSDEDFLRSMACDEASPLWKGMKELLDRAEDEIWEQNSVLEVSRDQRADIGIAAAVIRRLRYEMEGARENGIELQKNNR